MPPYKMQIVRSGVVRDWSHVGSLPMGRRILLSEVLAYLLKQPIMALGRGIYPDRSSVGH